MGVPADDLSLKQPLELLEDPLLRLSCRQTGGRPRVLTGVSWEEDPVEEWASSPPSSPSTTLGVRLGAKQESKDWDSEEGVVACDGPCELPPTPLWPAIDAMLKDLEEASMSISSCAMSSTRDR